MASIKTVNTPVGTIYEVNGKAYKDKTKADAALAALNQQQENEQIQQAEQNLDRDLQFAEENQGKLYGEDIELDRLADDAGVQESLELLRDNVDMDSEEQIAMRESATTGLQAAEKSQQRELLSSLSAGGVKGGAAGASLQAQAQSNLQNRAQLEQNLYLQQQNLRRAAVSELANYQTQIARFDIGQAAAEMNARIQERLALVNMASNERSSIRQHQASLAAAEATKNSGGKK